MGPAMTSELVDSLVQLLSDRERNAQPAGTLIGKSPEGDSAQCNRWKCARVGNGSFALLLWNCTRCHGDSRDTATAIAAVMGSFIAVFMRSSH